MSMVTVVDFLIPVFGTVLATLCLDEPFMEWKNQRPLTLNGFDGQLQN